MTTQPIRQNLSDAVTAGDLEAVRQIVLSNPMSARWSNQEQIPVIALAVQYGHLDIVKFLVENKARLNWTSPNCDENLYTMAKHLGHESVAEYLKPLMDPDLQKIVDSRAKQSQSNLYETVTESGEMVDDFTIFEKIQNKDVEAVRQMLMNKVNVNVRFEDDITPLIAAVGQGNIEMVRMLVQAGADVNALDTDFESALLRAKIKGFDEIAQYLEPLTSSEVRTIVDEQIAD